MTVAKLAEAAAEKRPAIGKQLVSDEWPSITRKMSIGPQEFYLTVALKDNGQPREILITISKEGSTVSGLFRELAKSINRSLRNGVPLDVIVKDHGDVRFEPFGMTNIPEIPEAKSIIDLVMRWLELKFINAP